MPRDSQQHRGLRFSLRELALLMGVVAVVLVALLGPQRQRMAVDHLQSRGAWVRHYMGTNPQAYYPVDGQSLWRLVLGEQGLKVGEVRLSGKITDLDWKQLRRLRHLHTLELERADLTAFDPSGGDAFAELTTLRLSDSQLGPGLVSQLAELPKLDRLEIRNTGVDDALLATLTGSPLTVLDARGTPLTLDCLPALQRFPNLQHAYLLGIDLLRHDLDNLDLARQKFQRAHRTDTVTDPECADQLASITEAWHNAASAQARFRVRWRGTWHAGGTGQLRDALLVDAAGRASWRHEHTMPGPENAVTLSVYDGKTRSVLHSAFLQQPPQGLLTWKRIDWETDIQTQPIAIALQPALLQLEALTDARREISGTPARKVYHKRGVLWIEEQAPFRPLRYLELNRGVLRRRIDFAYEASRFSAWTLKQWTQQERLTGEFTMHVEELIIDPPLRDNDFRIVFPAGTVLRDERTQRAYQITAEGDRKQVPW